MYILLGRKGAASVIVHVCYQWIIATGNTSGYEMIKPEQAGMIGSVILLC